MNVNAESLSSASRRDGTAAARGTGNWKSGVGNARGRCARQAVVIGLAVFAVACRQDMHDAPRLDPLEASSFFADGRAARVTVANTVARGQLRADEHMYLGRVDGQPAAEFPMPVTAEMMARGR